VAEIFRDDSITGYPAGTGSNREGLGQTTVASSGSSTDPSEPIALLNKHGQPLASRPSLLIPEALHLFETPQNSRYCLQPQVLLRADGQPLKASGNAVIRAATAKEVSSLLPPPHTENPLAASGTQEKLREVLINPFRPAAQFFGSLTEGNGRGKEWIDYAEKLLKARSLAAEQLRDSEGHARALELALELYICRGPSSTTEDFAPSLTTREYRNKGEKRSVEMRLPGPLEAVTQAAVQYVVSDDVARGTPLGVTIASTVRQLLQESRIQYHQDGQKNSLTATPQLPSLTSVCVDALEGQCLSKPLRSELYHILAQVELPPKMATRILRVQASNQERIGVGEYRSDITHPTAIHFYSILQRGGAEPDSEGERFINEQRNTRDELIHLLSSPDPQALFDSFDSLLNRASTLVYSGVGVEGTDPVGQRRIGIEFEYVQREGVGSPLQMPGIASTTRWAHERSILRITGSGIPRTWLPTSLAGPPS
jgi:hypothetical protein